MLVILSFILGLGLLIFIHEFGHFVVAKLNGIRVERFSLGFGPRLIKFTIGETEYCLSALPFGGYVKMTGQDDFGPEEDISPNADPRAFTSKSILARLSVVVAGPIMNLILPFILFPAALMIGVHEHKVMQESPHLLGVLENSPTEVAGLQKGDLIKKVMGKEVSNWKEALEAFSDMEQQKTIPIVFERSGEIKSTEINVANLDKCGEGVGLHPLEFLSFPPVIGEIEPNSPAEAEGLKVEDRVLAINDEAVEEWQDITKKIRASNAESILIKIKRDKEILDFKIKPKQHKCVRDDKSEKLTPIIGIMHSRLANSDYQVFRYSFSDALTRGVEKSFEFYGLTFHILKKLVTGKLSMNELGGPFRIAQASGQRARHGMGEFFIFLCFLSIQLGVLNLLPIPVLDGGHVMFLTYEAIFRKPLSVKIRYFLQVVFLILLFSFMIFITFNDIIGIWSQSINHLF